MIIFLSIMCFGCSKESFHRDGSFEYPQYMFWLRIKKKFSLGHVHYTSPASISDEKQVFSSTVENSVDSDQMALLEAS